MRAWSIAAFQFRGIPSCRYSQMVWHQRLSFCIDFFFIIWAPQKNAEKNYDNDDDDDDNDEDDDKLNEENEWHLR